MDVRYHTEAISILTLGDSSAEGWYWRSISSKSIPAVRTNGDTPDAFPCVLAYCPSCGRVWAKVIIFPAAGWPKRTWQARPHTCALCGGTGEVLPLTTYPKEHSVTHNLLVHDLLAICKYYDTKRTRAPQESQL